MDVHNQGSSLDDLREGNSTHYLLFHPTTGTCHGENSGCYSHRYTRGLWWVGYVSRKSSTGCLSSYQEAIIIVVKLVLKVYQNFFLLNRKMKKNQEICAWFLGLKIRIAYFLVFVFGKEVYGRLKLTWQRTYGINRKSACVIDSLSLYSKRNQQ